MRQGFFGVFRGRKKSMKRTGLYWVEVKMPSAFGRLSPSATVTIPPPPPPPPPPHPPPPGGGGGRQGDNNKRHHEHTNSTTSMRQLPTRGGRVRLSGLRRHLFPHPGSGGREPEHSAWVRRLARQCPRRVLGVPAHLLVWVLGSTGGPAVA